MDERLPPDEFHAETKAAPIDELQNLTLEDDPEFPQRVRKSLNRHILMGDSLEFSMDMFQKTMWEYVKTIVEIWPPPKGEKPE